MAKKIHLERHDTLDEWHEKIKNIRNNEHKLKMLVIEKILANSNISAREVQSIFFISPRTMYNWINQYNKSGLEGLKAENSKGRGSGKGNLKADNEVFEKLKEELEKEPKRKWTGKEKQKYIKLQFNIELTEQAIAYRLKNI